MRYEVLVLDKDSQLISQKVYRKWSTACYFVRDAINKGAHHACAWDLWQGQRGRAVYEVTDQDKVN